MHVHVFRSRQTSLARRSYAADFLSIKCVLFSWGKAPSLGPIPVFFLQRNLSGERFMRCKTRQVPIIQYNMANLGTRTCSLASNALSQSRADYDTIRYDTRCYFNARSKADISQLNLPHGTRWRTLLGHAITHSPAPTDHNATRRGIS